MRPEKLETLLDWLQLAHEDLETARILLNHESVHPRKSCFNVQQSVEKYFKAVLVFNDSDFTKTHDLQELARHLPENAPCPLNEKELALLTNYAVEIRYPGALEDLSVDEAEDSLQLGSEVERTTRNYLLDQLGQVEGAEDLRKILKDSNPESEL